MRRSRRRCPHLADKEYVQRFRDEANVVVRLSHGNLVTVFDAGQVGGRDLPGHGLRRGQGPARGLEPLRARRGSPSPSTSPCTSSRSWPAASPTRTPSAASSSSTATSRRRTCCCRTRGEVKLTDFGLAVVDAEAGEDRARLIYGKVSYMSPEQARGEPLDGRTDLYSAGIILWELLTGGSCSRGAGVHQGAADARSCCAGCATRRSRRPRSGPRACPPSWTPSS